MVNTIMAIVSMVALAGASMFIRSQAQEQALPIQAEAQPQAPLSSPLPPREQWAVDFLARLGNAQPTAETVAMVVEWTLAEDGCDTGCTNEDGSPRQSAFERGNPLNTTMPGGDTGCNMADCVREYTSGGVGMDATVATITNGLYDGVVAALQANDPEGAKQALWASPWASSHYGYGASWPAYAVEDTRGGVPPVSCPTCDTPYKARVTESAYTSASFTTRDCGAWGFQVNCQHWGTDFMGDEGTPVYAPFDLTIIALGEYPPGPTWGQYVQGTFPDGYVFYSGHLEGRPGFQVGETVPVGTVIGYTNGYNHSHVQLAPPGNTGACAQDGSCVDFEQYYREH